MSEKIDDANQNVPGFEELAGGLTLLVWVIALSILFSGLVQNGGFEATAYATMGGAVIIIFTPIGAILFASGFSKILKSTRR